MIEFKIEDDVAVLALNRPDRANALCEEMVSDISSALEKAVAEGARALLLRANGKSFCAGGMLTEPLPDDAGLILEKHLNPLMVQLRNLPMPIVVAVNGTAAGAGLSFALAGDIVVAGPSARFQAAFTKVGLTPDAGSSWLLPRCVGWRRAMTMFITGGAIDAEMAENWGLVSTVVDDDKLLDASFDAARVLAAGATKAMIMARAMAFKALESDFETALALERQSQREAGRTEDFKEGAAAFRERRAPVYKGR